MEADSEWRLPHIEIVQVFTMVRKEDWYKPDIFLYREMMDTLGKNKLIEVQIFTAALMLLTLEFWKGPLECSYSWSSMIFLRWICIRQSYLLI